jgi:hypothetical protein
MNNIFATTRPIEFEAKPMNLRNWRFLGMEMEVLGTRLDAARAALAGVKSEWGRWYWTETIDRLMLQWRRLVPLHDSDAKTTVIPRWSVDYEWWEDSTEIAGWDISDKLFEKIFRGENLDQSWHRIRDARIMRCNCH